MKVNVFDRRGGYCWLLPLALGHGALSCYSRFNVVPYTGRLLGVFLISADSGRAGDYRLDLESQQRLSLKATNQTTMDRPVSCTSQAGTGRPELSCRWAGSQGKVPPPSLSLEWEEIFLKASSVGHWMGNTTL